LAFSWIRLNLGFLLRERLAAVLIIPSSWGSQLDGDLHHHHHSNQTPRGRYDEHIGKFPSVQNQGLIEPVGERTNFRRLMLAGLATAPDNLYMAPYLGRSSAPVPTWNLHTTQPKYFTPISSEVVNLTGLL
jgi:hypothetical protein